VRLFGRRPGFPIKKRTFLIRRPGGPTAPDDAGALGCWRSAVENASGRGAGPWRAARRRPAEWGARLALPVDPASRSSRDDGDPSYGRWSALGWPRVGRYIGLDLSRAGGDRPGSRTRRGRLRSATGRPSGVRTPRMRPPGARRAFVARRSARADGSVPGLVGSPCKGSPECVKSTWP
jgi:hypothetical protein